MGTIRSLLVANRGEIARRIIRSAHAMGVTTVAIYSNVDADEPFVREADVAVRIGGSTPAESYLRSDAIINAALTAGADAIHPGYGFLSENAAFARKCDAAGITFVGPTAEVIDAMGSKLEAKALMERSGVPVLPYADVTALAGEELEQAADRVGYPILVKPSAGGGGKGMRVVSDRDNLLAQVAASRREAMKAFGDDSLMLERYVPGGRHVEIQILGDLHGNIAHLGERECSIQRRHQKVLEESPSPALDDELREQMTAAAVAAGSALNYHNAGTVEFLLSGREFFFLEVNTRLQVEHPVTEMVTGLDLVALQIAIAEGARLPSQVYAATSTGHAIEVRLYAEDPRQEFLPQTGRITHLYLAPVESVRFDSGVESGSEISVYYDPMVAKLIAHAPTRTEAARLLARTVRRAEIDGLTTNRDFLVRLLTDRAYLGGDVDTQFLESSDAERLKVPLLSPRDVQIAAAAAALSDQASRRQVASSISSGWRNHPSELQRVRFTCGEEEVEVGYRFRRSTLEALEINGEPVKEFRLIAATPEDVQIEVDGVRLAFRVRRAGDQRNVNGPVGQCSLHELPRFPEPGAHVSAGALVAPMPGVVIRVDSAVGALVQAGQALLVLEAMKMEHLILAPNDGVVSSLPVEVGTQVDAGTVLASIVEPA